MSGKPAGEIVVGRRPILEALRHGVAIHRLWIAKDARGGLITEIRRLAQVQGIPCSLVERSVLDRYGSHHQGAVAFLAAAGYAELDELLAGTAEEGVILVLDGITDPQNLGAIARSAEAFGASGIIIPRHHAAGLTPGALKASAGALLNLPVARVPNLSQALAKLAEHGYWSLVADPIGGRPLWTEPLRGRIAFVVGAEDRGVSPILRRRADGQITIPLRGKTASLNASVAAALLLYEWRRQNTVRDR